jgi:hypothetical protein
LRFVKAHAGMKGMALCRCTETLGGVKYRL